MKKIHKITSYILVSIIIISTLLPFGNVWAADTLGAANVPGNASATDADFVPSDAPEINAESAIVMDLDTGDILYEKAAFTERYPASITKVLTCLLAVENGNVNDTITVSEAVMDQVDKESSYIGLVEGEQLTLRDALYGMMLNSGNECALAIAEYIAGSTSAFADMMNETARKLGCKASHFVNPNGIHSEDHYTCAYDMALIGRAAYQYPEFKKLISSQSYEIPETNMNEARSLWQENRLIYSGNGEYYYEYCTGGKTGFTQNSLATLISFAERDGRRLVTVVLKCNPTTESYLDTKKLDEFCFKNYKLCKPLFGYDINQINREDILILDNYYNDLNHDLVKYYVNQNYSFYTRSYISDEQILKRLNVYSVPRDGVAGRIEFVYNDEVIGETEITTYIPTISATSTDALKNKKVVAEEPNSKLTYYIWLAIKTLIILIIIVLLLIIYIKLHKWSLMRETKRNIKYYPYKRDIRRNKELQKELEEKERQEKERQEKEKQEKEKLEKKKQENEKQINDKPENKKKDKRKKEKSDEGRS